MVTSIDKLLQQDIDFPEAVISTVSKSVLHGLEYLNQLVISLCQNDLMDTFLKTKSFKLNLNEKLYKLVIKNCRYKD